MSMVLVCKACGARVDLAPECPKCGNHEKEFCSYVQLSAPSSRLLDDISYDFTGEPDINLVQDVARALITAYQTCKNGADVDMGNLIFRPFFWYDPDDSQWTVQVKVYSKV